MQPRANAEFLEQNAARSGLESVVAQLDRLVIDESEPGSALPSEGELALRYGVSRLTIREALKVLAGRDLVELRSGKRAVVRSPSSETLSRYLNVAIRRDPSAILELNEIRLGLEAQAASLAATQATKASLTVLRGALQRMADLAENFDRPETERDYHQADIEFHEALAIASGNQMLALVLTSFEDALRASFAESFRGHFKRGGSLMDSVDLHRKVFERVEAGDPRGAAAAMRTTLRESKRDLRAAFIGDDRDVRS